MHRSVLLVFGVLVAALLTVASVLPAVAAADPSPTPSPTPSPEPSPSVTATTSATATPTTTASATASATVEPPTPPSVEELCAAPTLTVAQGLLDGLPRDALAGGLAPLLTLTVDTPLAQLAATVDLPALRLSLGCAPTPTSTAAPVDVDCENLTREQAQAILDADPHDPHDLDPDLDGRACRVTAGRAQVRILPRGAVEAGGWP